MRDRSFRACYQRLHDDFSVVPRRHTARADGVENRFAVRQERGPVMRSFATAGIQFCQRLRRSAVGADAEQRCSRRRCVGDRSIDTPGAAAGVCGATRNETTIGSPPSTDTFLSREPVKNAADRTVPGQRTATKPRRVPFRNAWRHIVVALAGTNDEPERRRRTRRAFRQAETATAGRSKFDSGMSAGHVKS